MTEFLRHPFPHPSTHSSPHIHSAQNTQGERGNETWPFAPSVLSPKDEECVEGYEDK